MHDSVSIRVKKHTMKLYPTNSHW